jgi:hypothetical protein
MEHERHREKGHDSNSHVYINQYYEKNITKSEITTHYYLGGKQIAVSVNSTVNYILQDQVGSTSVTADAYGDITSAVRYFAFGDCRNSTGVRHEHLQVHHQE